MWYSADVLKFKRLFFSEAQHVQFSGTEGEATLSRTSLPRDIDLMNEIFGKRFKANLRRVVFLPFS